jgi:hypothetical protein
MEYIYDVFVSYKRHRDWTPWTREHIFDLLDAYLTQELGDKPSIFIDDKIEPGADWPNRLGNALARSRVLLPIFSGDYFGSDWCLHELDLLHGRMLINPGKVLIIPIQGHDGDLIPKEIARLQPVDFREFRNPDIQRKTPRFEKFADEVGKLAPKLAQAIGSVPVFDPAWVQEYEGRFDQVYSSSCGDRPRVNVTTLTLKPLPYAATATIAVPRVTL